MTTPVWLKAATPGLAILLTTLALAIPVVAGAALGGAVPDKADKPAVDAPVAQWTITDLGTLGGAYSNGRGISNRGDAVGTAYTAGNGSYHAFLFDGQGMADLGTLGGANSRALGVNDHGWVAGSSYLRGNAREHAFFYTPARGMVDLGTLGGRNSTACAVNNRGEVTGFSDVAAGAHHAFLYSHGRMQDLGALGGPASAGRAVNARGWVAGDSDVPGGRESHAFLYRDGKLHDLGTLGGSHSSARVLNARGWVAGDADLNGDASHHAFLYRNGRMEDLGSLGGPTSYAYGMNNRGQVVGYSDTTPIRLPFRIGELQRGIVPVHLGYLYAFDHHAFLYDGGRMLDLSTLPEVRAAGWSSLNYAYAINDRGEIVGDGTINGTLHAFLLVPAKAAGPGKN